MGIDIGCCLIVGLPADNFDEDIIGDQDLYDYVSDNELDYSSPWYDSGISEGVIGFYVEGSDNFSLVNLEKLNNDVKEAKERFQELTGMEAGLYLSNHVT